MGLIIDLEKKEFWIDGNNPVFEDSEYQGIGFRILVGPLDRIQIAQIRKRFTKIKRGGRETTKDEEVEIELFIQQVKEWEGINDTKDKPIPCNDDTKRLIATEMFLFASMVNVACMNVRKQSEEQKEDEAKNLQKPGGGK